jgi:hypothetical protein
MKLNEYLTAINKSKEKLMDTADETVEKEYSPFIVNKCLSYFPDTIFQVNEMNFYSGLDKKIQFNFLQASIRPRKRYSKWMRNTKMKYLEDVKTYYGYSNRKAKEVIRILSKEQLENIRNVLSGVCK